MEQLRLGLGGIRSDHSINNDEDDGGGDDGDEDQNYMVGSGWR